MTRVQFLVLQVAPTCIQKGWESGSVYKLLIEVACGMCDHGSLITTLLAVTLHQKWWWPIKFYQSTKCKKYFTHPTVNPFFWWDMLGYAGSLARGRFSVVRFFSSCRSICQSEDEDEAQHRNCTLNTTDAKKNIDKLQTTAGRSRQVQCIIGLFASAPRTTTLDRQFTQIQRMHVGYFYFWAFTGTTQQSIFCVFALHKFVGSIISTSGDPSLTFAHLCHGALWSCIWPRWCWNMMKKAETLRQTHTTWIGYTVYEGVCCFINTHVNIGW